jgi:hypothetical protein
MVELPALLQSFKQEWDFKGYRATFPSKYRVIVSGRMSNEGQVVVALEAFFSKEDPEVCFRSVI